MPQKSARSNSGNGILFKRLVITAKKVMYAEIVSDEERAELTESVKAKEKDGRGIHLFIFVSVAFIGEKILNRKPTAIAEKI